VSQVLQPKTGFLRTLVSAVANGDVPDAFVVPISLSCECARGGGTLV
jgi:glycerol-3-phosphate O-acyltransferase